MQLEKGASVADPCLVLPSEHAMTDETKPFPSLRPPRDRYDVNAAANSARSCLNPPIKDCKLLEFRIYSRDPMNPYA